MDNKIEHEYTAEIVCPHCGYKYGDSWEYNNDDGNKIECECCDKKFILSVNFSVDYSTSKIDCEEEKKEHTYIFSHFYHKERKYGKGLDYIILPEEEQKFYKIYICEICDNNKYDEITKEEYLKENKI